MKYVIEIECDNAAFYQEYACPNRTEIAPGNEVMRILTHLMSGMSETDLPEGPILDYNGNNVGESRIIGD